MYLLAGVLAVSLLGACGPVQKKASAGEEGQVVLPAWIAPRWNVVELN